MKKLLFFLLLIPFLNSCEKDPYPLDLNKFDVRWYDDDHSGTQTTADALEFNISILTTSPDPDDQYITEWEFTYTINGTYAGTLQGDDRLSSNEINFNGEIAIHNLVYPGPGHLQPGDAVEFQIWAIDNRGTQVSQAYRYVIEN